MNQTDENKSLTIGELARQAGMRPSALRYYEQQGLLPTPLRTESGYRLYHPDNLQDLRFIQRAQRLGFSLADIHVLLDGWRAGKLDEETFLEAAEKRYLALEQQATQLLILQHELGLFLQDIYQHAIPLNNLGTTGRLPALLERICNDPFAHPDATIFDRLLKRTGCQLNTQQAQEMLDRLRGCHIHIWQEEEGYAVLVVSNEPHVKEALEALSKMAFNCSAHAHSHQVPELMHNSSGYLLQIRGENAFILARLFLEIENNHAQN